MKILNILLLSFSFYLTSQAQVHVAPNGQDTNPGTISAPVFTLAKAHDLATAGQTIYMRGGTYNYSATFKTKKDGTAMAYYTIAAYLNEKPVLDFSGVGSGSRGLEFRNSYWALRGIKIRKAKDNGIIVTGGYNILERCEFEGNGDSGVQISQGGHHTKVINCDSWDNYDSGNSGGNADGFAPKLDVGDMNEFRGCRAWHNSDDGWDLYANKYSTIIDSCWTWGNGFDEGNGNGFKTGGSKTISKVTLTNCIAFNNSKKGFDQNHNMAGVIIYNCTGYRNGAGNFYFYEKPTGGTNKFKNNISFVTLYRGDSVETSCEQGGNSWMIGNFTVSASDFSSLDSTQVLRPRKADGSLPDIDFLKLSGTSRMINAGVNVGLPFFGSAPDCGAFEYFGPSASKEPVISPVNAFRLYQNYPNPFNPVTQIQYEVMPSANDNGVPVRLRVFDIMGREVAVLVSETQKAGLYSVPFSAATLGSGTYLYELSIGLTKAARSMIVVK